MPNIQLHTSESLCITSPSETLFVEDKQPFLPNATSFPTCIPQSCPPMESNSPPTQYSKGGLEGPKHLSLLEWKPATSLTQPMVALTAPADTATTANLAERMGMGSLAASKRKLDKVGLQPKFLRYNLWTANSSLPFTTDEWTETAKPLPRPPRSELEDPNIAETLRAHPHLFSVNTPVSVDLFELMLDNHPNQPFIHSVCQGLQEGFWPWANTHRTGYPITHHEPAKGVPDATRLKFFRRQLRHEQMKGRYSQAVGPTLLPGMYSLPIYAVPKPHSPDL